MYWDSMTQSYIDDRKSPRQSRSPFNTFMDKENIQSFNSPSSRMDSDISIYVNNSPSHMSCDGSPAGTELRRRLEDLDNNSQDSGYSTFESTKFSSPKSRGLSFGSHTSMDEMFLDISELENEEDSTKLPGDFSNLITGSLSVKDVQVPAARPSFRRALSMISNSNTPTNSRARSCLFRDIDDVRNFKRPEPPTELQNPIDVKRGRLLCEETTVRRVDAKSIFKRSISASESSIKSALQRSSTEPDLIGDFTKAFCLPLINGKHQDLKSITAETLAELMSGEFTSTIASFKVIDCRYPYEYDGGHIVGAHNLYTKQQIEEELLSIKNKNGQPEASDNKKRHILIFHCEFSSERGPNLSRYLRNIDRNHNKDFYPLLHYPEVYLLDGGYKNFFEKYAHLCAPNGYLPMLHPDHEDNLRHFRARSKTWNSDAKRKFSLKNSLLKRL